ncbi:DUF6325 family protein [Microbacterium sp. No. 7]|uniref:DUF6325 family protein n=1 Tax=Microbacterium sp. No. 7 TaxID=1714373 RepID=UPI0006D03A3D|nr:DUF6325 family protein [Microbacterium sp. No. 7]
MATTTYCGPIDVLVVSVSDPEHLRAGVGALLDRVTAGLIEILDVELIALGDDGGARRMPMDEVPAGGALAAFAGAETDILAPEDLDAIADALQPGDSALAVVYEERSMAAVVEEWTGAGARLLWSNAVEIDEIARQIEED